MRLADLPKRFQDKILVYGECWIWCGTIGKKDGHGRVSVRGKYKQAHRAIWEILVGPIPEGHDLHHFVCEDKECVRPIHLRPLTHGEHSRLTISSTLRKRNGTLRKVS